MFGHPSWFREKDFGWGLVPIAWQGWVYVAVWMGVMGLPFAALLASEKPWEAAIWFALAMGVMLYDVWLLVQGVRAAREGEGPTAEDASPDRAETTSPPDPRRDQVDLYIE